jgi:protein-disulfide isomerase
MRAKLLLLLIILIVGVILFFISSSASTVLSSLSDNKKIEKEQAQDETKTEESNVNFKAPPAETSDHTNEGKFFESDLILGDRDSKVVIIEYFALTCPHCAYFHKNVYPKLKEKYLDTKKIAFIQREFVASKPDLYAAILSRCAGNMRRGMFYDVLLERQESWAFNRNFEEILTNIGQIGGVSPEQFKSCIQDEKLGNDIMVNTKLISRTPGFVGTPVFIINNRMHHGSFAFEELSRIIDNLLAENEKKDQ